MAGAFRRLGRGAAVLLLSCAHAAAATAPVGQPWRDCLGQSDAEARFDCLQAHEASQLGNTRFEEQLALAARQSGRLGYASIVLQRLLWHDPGHAGARLDLALIAIEMGDFAQAREQLHRLRALDAPPPPVRRLLAALEQRLARPKEPRQLAISLQAGYDSNANLGIRERQIALSLDGVPVDLSPGAAMRPHASPWLETSLSLRRPLTASDALQLYLRQQRYTRATAQSSYQLAAGIDHQTGPRQRLAVGAHLLDLNDGSWLAGLNAHLQRQLGCEHCLFNAGLSLQTSSQPAIGPLSLQAGFSHHYRQPHVGHIGEIGLAWQQQRDAPWGSTLNLSLASELYRPQGRRRDYLRLVARAAQDQAPFSPLFGERRRDTRFYGLTLGSRYRLTPQWSLAAQLALTRQHSDIPLYRYEREQLSLSLTWSP